MELILTPVLFVCFLSLLKTVWRWDDTDTTSFDRFGFLTFDDYFLCF